MKPDQESKRISIIVFLSFALVIGVNVAANLLPLNGVTTGEVSDSFQSLFTPASFIFSIWGLIYLLQFGYVILQFALRKNVGYQKRFLLLTIGKQTIIINILNVLWIVSWHYQMILINSVIMLVMLFVLMSINVTTRDERMSPMYRLFVRFTYSVYLGWITVATIANLMILLVASNLDMFGVSIEIWTTIAIVFSALFGGFLMINFERVSIGLVLLWAYTGILINHFSANVYDGKYKLVIFSLYFAYALIAVSLLKLRQDVKSKSYLN